MDSIDPDPVDPRADSLADRLADWLEQLGLDEALEAAGLPTYARDAQGHARWRDPHTRDPLSADQLAQLDALLHSEGSDPAHAVPVELVPIARRARLRRELLDSPTHDYESLARLRGESVNATRFTVHKAADANALLVLSTGDRTLVPAFQLTAAGEPRTDLLPLLLPLLSAGMDPWHAWTWLTQPAALLGGLIPHEAAADPEHAAVAQHAAVRLAERVAADH